MANKIFELYFKTGKMTTCSENYDTSTGEFSSVKDAARNDCSVGDFLETGNIGDDFFPYLNIKDNADIKTGAVFCEFKNGYKIVVNEVLSTSERGKIGLPGDIKPYMNRLDVVDLLKKTTITNNGVILSPTVTRFSFSIYSPNGENKTNEYYDSKYCPDNIKNIKYFELYIPGVFVKKLMEMHLDWDLESNGGIYTRIYMPIDGYTAMTGQKNVTRSIGSIDSVTWRNQPNAYGNYFPHLIAIALFTNSAKETTKGDDPGGESTSGGQNGNFDDTSDNIDVPTLPVTNASSCGMVKMYEMSLAQTQALAGYLWSGAKEFYENLTKMFNDPMDSIVSLSLAPIKPSVSAQTTVEICKYAIDNVTGFPLTSQYASLDCGTVKISPYWGNALDYAPYTKASIYLPFIGTQELNIDDVMNRTVGVIYNIDLLSGACACLITCDGSVMYNFSGNVISQIPVSGKNALEMYKSVISAVTNTALAVGTGAGGVALAGDVVSNGLSVMGSKMTVQRGGTISATNGVLGVKFPYITILRANQSLPADFHYFKGYPSNITGKVSSFSGYTEVEYVHVTGINATENELEMIEQILKEGFII